MNSYICTQVDELEIIMLSAISQKQKDTFQSAFLHMRKLVRMPWDIDIHELNPKHNNVALFSLIMIFATSPTVCAIYIPASPLRIISEYVHV